jgi:CheY-like chemotaxis protein
VSLVLVVDDDDDIREMLSFLLEDMGHTVVTASQGKEALSTLRHGPRPDLVILDLMMPVMSGWELREQMLRDPAIASIPTIVVSGDRSDPERDESLHAVATMAKPFEADKLLSLLAQIQLGQE